MVLNFQPPSASVMAKPQPSKFSSTGAGFGIDEIFETFFGGVGRGGSSRRPTRGSGAHRPR